jgi:SAM-dependent methyltransferase
MADAALTSFQIWWIDAFGEHGHIGQVTATRWFLDPLELGPNDIILDVGCFVGAALRLAARRYRCEGIGIDPEPRFLEVARAKAAKEGLSGQLRFSTGVAGDAGLTESSVNVVLSLEAPYDAAEAWRILKAHGRFCVATATQSSLEEFSHKMGDQGFRTERGLDATEEALAALEGVRERFQDKDEGWPASHLEAVEKELAAYRSGRRYLRWVGGRR